MEYAILNQTIETLKMHNAIVVYVFKSHCNL